jgi:hypothetical protein
MERHRLIDGTVVITDYDPPPIPIRDFDYVAYLWESRYDEELTGRGRTDADAIEDLLDRLEAME